MEITTINAEALAKAFLAGAKNLEAKKEWINELNVFPVPDGDTGTNMSMTILSAAKEVSAMEHPTMSALAKAISSGSLRGARGNSGVILSQLFRGFTKVIAEYDEINVQILSDAFERAVETAYKAVMKPKEGTILTVAKGMAKRASEMVDETDDLIVFCEAVIRAGDHVLSKTPDMLPVLKQAGVVDSGGQGLMQVMKGALDSLKGKEIDYNIELSAQPSGMEEGRASYNLDAQAAQEIKFAYCTQFLIMLDRPITTRQENEFKEYLESIGDSIVVVADDEIVKVHVHTNDPGMAMQRGLTYGSLTTIIIENMKLERDEKLSALKEKEMQSAGISEADKPQPAKEQEQQEEMPPKDMGFISVSIGEGINEIFKGLGVDHIIEGGQTMNPSTEDMLNAIAAVNAQTVFILPNNKNIILAANQAASLTEDKKVVVIPTKTIPQGITALINFIPDSTPEENEERMNAELSNVKSGQVTYAVRDTVIDDKEIKQDDYMGIGDDGILSVGQELTATVMDMMGQLIDEDSAIVSVYYGEDIGEDDANAIAAQIEEKFSDVEVEVHYGGQPIYYYVVSVE
ncbi:MAG: DAK2 domain-containing protein [Roseburia sp.]|nr:DAK2 domain-containing protein [Roseburia sp.]